MSRTIRSACALVAALAANSTAGAGQPHQELAAITVTSTPLEESGLSSAQPASVIAGDGLVLALAPTIGETVAREPGVHSTFFGTGASRPVIRGFGGDRVQVLTDGLATLDVSGLSEDHAVAIDPALADRIEVIRGPATLLHGTGATGGVVNVLTNRVHRTLPDGSSGLLELRGDTASRLRSAAGRLDAAAGRLVLHVDGVWRETDDYEIPGFAQSRRLRALLLAAGEEPSEAQSTVENSWTETRSGGIGLSYVGEDLVAGIAWSRHDTRYGVPGAHEHADQDSPAGAEEGPEQEEGGVWIDLEQDRYDLTLRRGFAGGSLLRVSASLSDYRHAEIDSAGAVGTLYEVDGREVRGALDHSLPGGFQGSAGLQWRQVELTAAGEEAFVPDSRTRTIGAFVFGQRDFGRFELELGARLDRQQVDGPGLFGYDDMAVNLSAGAIWPLGGGLALVGQVVRSERHPSSTELFADGPHAATGQFEIGDPGLRTERGMQADLGLRHGAGHITAELRAFVAAYDGYLFLSPTGAVEDGLPVFEYLQQDARFHGFEATALLPLGEAGWSVGLSADAVLGRLDGGGNLPRIPPFRLGAELAWERQGLRAALVARHSFAQDRVSDGELPSDAYTMLDVEVSWRPSPADILLFLRGINLLDEDARVHSSPLKDDVPLPGRALAAGVRFSFGG